MLILPILFVIRIFLAVNKTVVVVSFVEREHGPEQVPAAAAIVTRRHPAPLRLAASSSACRPPPLS